MTVPARRPAVSLARALSKLGLCSRTEAEVLIRAGRVRVGATTQRDPAFRVDLARDRVVVDGLAPAPAARMYVALHKPRGLVTTRNDPQGRPTIYSCLDGSGLPFVAPVGRLDRASEGLLLLTNDTRWGARILDPASHLEKVYHVQVRGVRDDAFLAAVQAGVVERTTGETLRVTRASLLRHGTRGGAWLEIALDEGRNRHIRRLLAELDLEVRRLIRVRIGSLVLGALPSGRWRVLDHQEVKMLTRPGGNAPPQRSRR